MSLLCAVCLLLLLPAYLKTVGGKKLTANKNNTNEKQKNWHCFYSRKHKVASSFSVSLVQLIDFRAHVSLWAQDVVSFAWGLTSSLWARSLWHQHVVLSQHVPLCSQKPHSSDSGAPEKSWKGHLAMEVKGTSFRDSQTYLYSLLSLSPFERRILSIGGSNICMGSWTKRLVCLCSTVNQSISPKMPVSLSSEGKKEKGDHSDDQMVKIIEFFMCK